MMAVVVVVVVVVMGKVVVGEVEVTVGRIMTVA